MKEEIRYIRNCYSCIAFGLCFYFVFLPILMHLAAIVEGLIYNEMYLQRFVGRALGISMWWVYLTVTDVRIVLKEITIWCTCWFKIYQTSRKSWDMDINLYVQTFCWCDTDKALWLLIFCAWKQAFELGPSFKCDWQ